MRIIIGFSIMILKYFLSIFFKVSGTWLRLTPFFVSVTIYFVLFTEKFYNSNLLSTCLKCLPIFLLMAFVFSYGVTSTKYHQIIFIALIFSSIGDAFLDYKDGELFPLGMASFAIAQICYITAFGFTPFKPILGLVLSAGAIGGE